MQSSRTSVATLLAALGWLHFGCGGADGIGAKSSASHRAAPRISEAEARQIVDQVSAARGLSIDRAVPISVLDETHFKQALVAHLHHGGEGDPKSEAAKEGAFLVGFDFLPPTHQRHDIPSFQQVLEEEVAGFYSEDDDRIFVPARPAKSNEDLFVGKAVLAHEAEHALQHRHFALPKKVASSDADLALTALVEGDAQVAMGAYIGLELGEPAGRTLRRIREATKRVPIAALDTDHRRTALARTIALARERLEFPYKEGMMFVSDIYRAGGFELVNQLYASPPTTTEQVLHPEKYLAGETQRSFKPLPAQPGHSVVVGDVLGEFQTRVLLARCNDPSSADKAAAGWDGDRFEILSGEGGGLVVAWSTAWDTEDDAREFEAAVAKSSCWSDNDLEGKSVTRSVSVRRSGQKVAFLRGATDKARDRLLAALLDQPGERPSQVAISGLRIPPRVELPEPEAGTINGDVYENPWLGVVARIPKGMRAAIAKHGEVGVTIDRPGEAIYAAITLSTRLATDELDKKTFGEAATAFRDMASEHGLAVEALGGGHASTPVGDGISRVFRVAGTNVEHRVVLVPICAGTGSIVFVEGYGDPFAKSVIDGFISSFRFTGGRNLKACDYLDPK